MKRGWVDDDDDDGYCISRFISMTQIIRFVCYPTRGIQSWYPNQLNFNPPKPSTRYPKQKIAHGYIQLPPQTRLLFYKLFNNSPTLRPISSLPTPSALLIVTPTTLPTSLTVTHRGATSAASNRTHRTASSLAIGFRSDICRCWTSVGIVKEHVP